jgi:hypothetical protein
LYLDQEKYIDAESLLKRIRNYSGVLEGLPTKPKASTVGS